MKARGLAAILIAGAAVAIVAVTTWFVTSSGTAAHDAVAEGGELYTRHCASCHESARGIGPELSGAVVRSYGSSDKLADYLRVTMPYGAPGSLTEQQYQDIAAYLLDSRAE